MKTLRRWFWKGLVVVLPVAATLYIIYWLGWSAEQALGNLIKLFIPDSAYWPGLGLLMTIVLILAVGALLNAWAVRKVFETGEAAMMKIPVARSVYSAVRDLMSFWTSGTGRQELRQVVVVTLPGGFRLIGFITLSDTRVMIDDAALEDEVAVYLPMSYQIGGYTALVPRSAIEPLDMSVEDALRLVLTAGMSRKAASPLTPPAESPLDDIK